MGRWCLVLDFSGVNGVDFTAIEMLEAFFEELKTKERGMTLLLCKLKTQVLDTLTKGEVLSDHLISKDNVLWELHEAEQWWDHKMDELATNANYYDDGHDRQTSTH